MGLKRSKVLRRLARRRADFDKGPQGSSSDAQRGRWTAGGYHRPGSNNK